MATQPSSSVMVECANRCKVSKGEGSGRYECSFLSCAWKAPRVLTGSLASTTLPRCSAPHRDEKRGIRRSRWLCHANQKSVDLNEKLGCNVVDFGGYQWSFRSDITHLPSKDWRTGCASSYMYPFDSISPDSLWEDMRPTISYLAQEELKFVNDALKLAFEAHDGQKRRSGEPFIIHTVEVARILGEHELDWESIAAGLLHDTVEDTKVVTFDRIEKKFGATMRHIVEGETKVSKLGKLTCKGADSSVQDVKADDLRQMFLAMTEEVRVIIVKLADRLHNMRTLSHMPPHKQASIALETLQVFAPLAKLLGMYQIKSELEYLSFMYTNPNDFVELKKRVEDLYKDYVKELDMAKKILRQKIEEDQFLDLVTVTTEVRSVCKELYSVYKTVLKSKQSIHEINQIAQLRIIVKPKSCNGVGPLCSAQQICYHLLGLVHGIWTPIPRAMKDYIATPKPNGYQSLHTTVMPFLYESMFHLEVQIRTEDMDLIAERGIAAHYSGKGVPSMLGQNTPAGRNSRGRTTCLKNSDFALRIGWLKAIREWQQEFVGNMSSREFVDTVMRDLLGSRVFVFTPKGEGATVIDYAYMIHTEIGNNMVAAKVNGNLVSPMHALANAEVIEIITYNVIPNKVLATANRKYSKEGDKHEFDQCLKYLECQLLCEHDLWYLFLHNMEEHSLPVSVELDAKVSSISGNNNTIPIEDTPHSSSGAQSVGLELSTKAMIASKRRVLSVDQSNISDIEFDKSQFFSLDEGSTDSTFTNRQVTIRSRRLLERRSKIRKVSKKSNNFDYEVASPRATNHIKKINKSLDNNDPLSLFLRGPETKQLLTIKEEKYLFTQIEDLMRLEDVKERLRLQTQREPTLAEWAQAVGMSCHGLQSCLSSGRHSRDKMISANLRLVVHVARQYEGKGLDLQDLLQEGSKGLMKSFEKFKPGAGSRFPTYAYLWIRDSIKKAIFHNSRTIRIPENAFALLKNIKNARRLCIQEGHLPTNQELAKRAGITVDKLESLLLNTRIPVSIQGRPWSDHDATFQEIIADPAIESPDLAVAKQMMRLHVHSLLNILKPKEKAIIQLQFGIHCDERKSLSQIGAMYGLSKERIRQIGNQALKKLKKCLLAQGLEAYLELLT